MPVKRTGSEMAKEALTIASEALLLPGTSLLVKGDIKPGLTHAGIGLAAKFMFGPVGALAVAANAYCKARTGQSLYSQFTTNKGPGDFTLREEVTVGLEHGDSLETIIESVTEDVEDIYYEAIVDAIEPQVEGSVKTAVEVAPVVKTVVSADALVESTAATTEQEKSKTEAPTEPKAKAKNTKLSH